MEKPNDGSLGGRPYRAEVASSWEDVLEVGKTRPNLVLEYSYHSAQMYR
jgi:hypothetical protein